MSDAAIKRLATDSGLGTGGSAGGGGAMGDSGVGQEAEGGEAKADRWGVGLRYAGLSTS